jgi:quercetin dioxygenase-like cupin family protein
MVRMTETASTRVWFAGALVTVHVSDERLGVWESEERRGDPTPPLHVHRNEDEHVIVLDGTARFRVGERTHDLGAGEAIALPRGVPHAHEITSPRARLLTIATPGGFERLFTALGVAGAEPSPPDFPAYAAFVRTLGVERV